MKLDIDNIPKTLKDEFSSWTKDELMDLIIEKAYADIGFYKTLLLMADSKKPETSKLMKIWNETEMYIIELSYEKYIDDQLEIELICDCCSLIMDYLDENDVNDGEMAYILCAIIDNGYYDEYGVYDAMKELSDKLKEKLDS